MFEIIYNLKGNSAFITIRLQQRKSAGVPLRFGLSYRERAIKNFNHNLETNIEG